MITLCLDTSYRHLAIALLKENTIIDCYEEICERKQSEHIFPILINLLQKNQISPENIDEMVITKGPGSYTGIRIAMTIAKIFGSLQNKKIYTVSTLQLYKAYDVSIIDAKGGKLFVGHENDECLLIEDVKKLCKGKKVTGDTAIIDYPEVMFSICDQFLNKKSEWKLVEDIDALVPNYLKEAV